MDTRFAVSDLLATLNFKVLAMQRVKTQRGWNFEQVISPFSHLWFVVAGQATVEHHGRAFELRPGCLHLVTPCTLHDCHGEDYLDCYQVHFISHSSGGMELFSMLDCDWQVAKSPGFKLLLERLWSICSGNTLSPTSTAPGNIQSRTVPPTPGANSISLAQGTEAQSILRQLLKPFLASAKLRQDMEPLAAEPFPAVQEFINHHLAEPIILADLARVAGLNPTYFSDRFQRQMGIRPLEYLTRLRMDRACYLLRTSKASIKEVTYNVGLRDPAYFSRLFQKYCHLSPSAYRTTCNA
jgi:AraC-like DNA-binding protein